MTTAIVISIGSKEEPRRVGLVNILFNLSKSLLVLVGVTVAHKLGLLDKLWDAPVNSSIIANTNTVFNLACALILIPVLGVYEKLSLRLIKGKPEKESKYKSVTDTLNPVFFNTPALALQSCYKTLLAMYDGARKNLESSFALIREYDPAVHKEILAEEDEIDRMTDKISHYMVEFLPHLQIEDHVAILNQYYKITSEFERLGDHAVNIAAYAETLKNSGTQFSAAALSELAVLESALMNILDETRQTFAKRDVEAAERIEPLVHVAGDLIAVLRRNHLKRMSTGECNSYADTTFTDLMVEFQRIAGVCSNVGVATVVRVHPELADHEHIYFDRLHSGGSEEFNAAYTRAYQRYFALLRPESAEPPKNDPPAAEAQGTA